MITATNTNLNNEKEIELKLVKLLTENQELLQDITEFNNRELKSISVLSMNPFMRKFFTSKPDKNLDYVDNKKHLKRKFEKTLLRVNKDLSEALGNMKNNDDSRFLNFFSRDKR